MSSDPLLDLLLADAAGMLLSTPGSSPPVSVPSSGSASHSGGLASGSSTGTVSDKLFSIVCVDCGDPRVCFSIVKGRGGAFCFRKDCSLKGHDTLAKSPFAGTGVKLVFIKRKSGSDSTVFAEPSLPWDQVPDQVRSEWLVAAYSLPRWSQEFQAVTLVDNVEATADEVKTEIDFLIKAETFKTPSKRKRYLDNKESMLGDWEVVTHNRILPDNKEELDKMIGIGLRRGLITEAVADLETSVVEMGAGMKEVTELTRDRFLKVEKEIDLLGGLVQHVKANVGAPVELDGRFVAPTLWGSTGFIAEELLRVIQDTQKLQDEVAPFARKHSALEMAFEENIANAKNNDAKVMKIMSMVMEKVKTMGLETENLKNTVTSVSNLVTSMASSLRPAKKSRVSHGSHADHVDELLSMLVGNSLEIEDAALPTKIKDENSGDQEKAAVLATLKHLVLDMESLKASAEDTSIKFGGLGFKNLPRRMYRVDQIVLSQHEVWFDC